MTVAAAARVAARLAGAPAFGEANKRTALVAALWLLEHNGFDPRVLIPPRDLATGRLLREAALGADVERVLLRIFRSRI